MIPVEIVVAETRHGDRPAFMAYMRDLSEQKRTEAALQASEARFQAAAGSIPDGLVILDPDDRIVFYNNRHPELLPPALREGLALGIRFEDWIREGLARGPVYHPDMGPDYAQRRLASRDEPLTEREHKHVDGRWVRIREARMPDGGRVLLTTDLTDRREAEARFLAAAESIPDGLAIFDTEDRFVYFNSRYPAHLIDHLSRVLRIGVRFEDWLREGLKLGAVYHPDMGDDYVERRLALHAQEEYESEHKIMDGRWIRVRESRMTDGGRVLLTTDVTEQRRRQQQLSLLAMAVDQVGDQVEIADASGSCTYVNPAFVRLTGFAPVEVIGRQIRDVLHSGRHEARFYEAIDRCLQRGGNWQGRIVNRRKDGELIYQDTTISPLRDGHGRITHYVAVKRDVTEQEKAEAAIRASEARYRAVVDTQTEFIARISPDGRLNFVNDAYCRYYGQTRDNLLGRVFNEFTDTLPEDRERDTAHLFALTPSCPSRTIELRRRLPDGRIRWVQWADTAIFNGEGQLVEVQSVGRDITDQRSSELALRESEARYRALVETQTEFVLRQLPEGRLTFVNEAYCRYVGLPREELLSGRFNGLDLMAPEDRPRFDEHLRGLTPERPTATMETRAILPDGSKRWERWVDTGIFDADGSLVELQSTGRDITDQKQSEIELRASEARYRAVVEGQSEFILRLEPTGNLTFVNDAYCRYRGLDRETMLGGFNDIVHYPAEQQAQIRAAWAGLVPLSPDVTYELVKPGPDGGQHWEEWTDTAIFAPDGRLLEIQAIGRDITARKLAEQDLVASEARFRLIAESVPLPIAITAVDRSCILFINAMGRDVFGLEVGTTDAEAINGVWVDMAARQEIDRRIAAEGSVERAEVRMRRRDGSELDAILSARPLHYGGERAVLGVITDIGERRQIEEALRESEARLAALMANAPLVVHLKDREGRYLLADPESAKIFGRDPADVVGRTAADIFPPAECEAIERHHLEVLETGRTHYHEEFQPSLDAYQWSMVIWFPIRDAQGEIAVVGCFALDITRSKLAEAEVKASAERFRTIADIHPTPMVITRMGDREVLFANRACFEVFKVRPDEFARFDRGRLYGNVEDRERLYADLDRGERIEGREIAMRTAAGELFPVMLTARSMTYEDSPACVMSYLDLSALKRAEAALRASEQRFRGIAEAHPMPLVIVRKRDGQLVFANQPFRRLFGLGEGELERAVPEEYYAEPHSRARFLDAMRTDGVVDGLEQSLRRVDGTIFPAATTARLIDYEGESAFVTSVVDLTELRAAEAEIRRQREALHQNEKLAALGSLLAGVAHELNNPLSVVVGYSSMLRSWRRRASTPARGARGHVRRRPSAAPGSSRPSSPWPASGRPSAARST